jgi:hypothetical protein
MPLPHNTATARIKMDGLAISCFNRARQLWEVGYLRHNQHGHRLILDIDGNADTPIEFRSKRGIIIRFETIQGISPFRDFPNGFFDRGLIANRKVAPANQDESENFRWAINLEEPPPDIGHGRGHLVKSPFPVTRAFIQNAVLYTLDLPVNDLHRLLVSENGETMSAGEFNQKKFGKTNNLIGADITCAAGGAINVVIEDDEKSKIIPLPHRPGNPWQITLTNMRPETVATDRDSHGGHGSVKALAAKPRKGDFHLYYDVFRLDDRRQERALWGFPEPSKSRGFKVSGRTDCNMVFLGTSSNLDVLF